MFNQDTESEPSLIKVLSLAAAAGGLGWGIRGQYGHETGAMIAGVLVGLVLVLLVRPNGDSAAAARAAAWFAIALGIGGSMTYAQTVGLTQDTPYVGNERALAWGLLGLALKGGLWWGFGGVALGMGLSGVRYQTREWAGLGAGALILYFGGVWLLNRPFDPAQHRLPLIYFSADWRWQPGAILKPRVENWGGLLLAFLGWVAYTAFGRQDSLAPRLAFWGVLGGAIGFPLGQSIQAFHAWHQVWFQAGPMAHLEPLLNWWNFMETSFGAVAAGGLGLGLWIHRRRISPLNAEPSMGATGWGLAGLGLHVAFLLLSEFGGDPWTKPIASWTDSGIGLAILPLVACALDRRWAWWLLLPVTLLPIGVKTVENLAYDAHAISAGTAWWVYFVVPLAFTLVAAQRWTRPASERDLARRPLAGALLLTAWLYFSLNFAFFRYPWPWTGWTSRTPNAVVFAVCLAALTWFALVELRTRSRLDGSRR